MVLGIRDFRKALDHTFVPNEVPSVDQQHLDLVRDIKVNLKLLMGAAYPDSSPDFVGRPELRIPVSELRQGIEKILNDETMAYLAAEEARLRPPYETRGLETAFGTLLPIAMAGFEKERFQYEAVVDAQCLKCMKDGQKPQSGLNFGNRYQVGDPVSLDYFANGGWKDLQVVATDQRLAADGKLRGRLTPECERHGRDHSFQLAVVHRITVVPNKKSYRQNRVPGIAPDSPIFETRPKSSFELLWKMVRYLEGSRDTPGTFIGGRDEGVPDAFGARIRVPDDASLASRVFQAIKASPVHWQGSVKPQNFENVYDWLTSKGVTFTNGDATHFKSLLKYAEVPEEHNVYVRNNGGQRRARYVELFFPFGAVKTTLESNCISLLCYTDKEYTDLQGTVTDDVGNNLQNRLGYHIRRLGKREESTLGEWLIASRLAEVSVDPSNVAYNRKIINLRLGETEKYTRDAEQKRMREKATGLQPALPSARS